MGVFMVALPTAVVSSVVHGDTDPGVHTYRASGGTDPSNIAQLTFSWILRNCTLIASVGKHPSMLKV